MRKLGLGILFSGLMFGPAFAQTDEACKAWGDLKMLEQQAVNSAKSNEDAQKSRENATNDLQAKTTAELQAKEAWQTANRLRQTKEKENNDAAKALQDAQVKHTELQQKMQGIEQRITTAQALCSSQTQQGQDSSACSDLSTAQQERQQVQPELDNAKKAEETAKTKYDETKKAFEEAEKDEKDKDGKYKEASQATAKAKEATQTANTTTRNTGQSRTQSHNQFLNQYRNLALKAQRCKYYRPSEIGLALTATKWKTAQRVAKQVLTQSSDRQRDLFGGGRAITGRPNDRPNLTPGSRTALLGGFGNGTNLPPTLQRNLESHIRTNDANWERTWGNLERTWAGM